MILSWNVRGSGSSDKRRGIKSLICSMRPDIVILQEVRRSFVDIRFVGSIWSSRFKEWIFLPVIGSAKGILVVWDSRKVRVLNKLIGSFSVSIEIPREESSWCFLGVYGPCQQGERGAFWDELAGLGEMCGAD